MIASNPGLDLNNVRLLQDDEDTKHEELSSELLDLKLFTEEYQKGYNYPLVIIHLKNIHKISIEIFQQSDTNLWEAKEFEFCIRENLINGFASRDSLIEAVPDYISLGYERSNSNLQCLGSPISLFIQIPKIIIIFIFENKKFKIWEGYNFNHIWLL